MAVDAVAMAVSSTAALLVTVPPGPSLVALANASGHTVFLGTGNHLTTTNGFPIVSGTPPLEIPGFLGSAATPLWAMTATSSVSLGVLISTDH